ncbi:hypothetical protein IW261DRAFT_1609709 [Armillaria novae-zelandiae]|uniref:Uncharacterized protein n=1 Tax=Armillaria novae-zelandiae TaxID=153914 RepID=A0AA39P233_9AGAR|nr:hypothetical protein IW261DRAFT_1609709 [Armillaria novae-zelandiae]
MLESTFADFMPSHWQDTEEASEEHLPTMRDALKGLHDMEASVFHYINSLILQVATCAPFQKKATLAIFEPLRDAVVDFLNPVFEAQCSHVAPVISYFASLVERPTPPASESSWSITPCD